MSIGVIDIVALILIVALAFDGLRVGFVKTFFSVVKISIGVVAAVICSSGIAGNVSEKFKDVLPGAFLVVFLVVFGILGTIERLFNLIDKIPVAKQINRIVGFAAGIVKGIVIMWSVFWVASTFADVEWIAKANEYIKKSELFLVIDRYSPLHYIIK